MQSHPLAQLGALSAAALAAFLPSDTQERAVAGSADASSETALAGATCGQGGVPAVFGD